MGERDWGIFLVGVGIGAMLIGFASFVWRCL